MYHCIPPFYYIKVGLNRVYIAGTCFPEDSTEDPNSFYQKIRRTNQILHLKAVINISKAHYIDVGTKMI